MVYNFHAGIRQQSKIKTYIVATVASAVLTAAALALPAFAAGNDQTSLTVGNCISDGLYGNEPNMADGALGGPAEQEPGTKAGNVVPTQSPGPFVNVPSDPDNPVRGRSVGQWQQEGVNVPEACRTLVNQ